MNERARAVSDRDQVSVCIFCYTGDNFIILLNASHTHNVLYYAWVCIYAKSMNAEHFPFQLVLHSFRNYCAQSKNHYEFPFFSSLRAISLIHMKLFVHWTPNEIDVFTYTVIIFFATCSFSCLLSSYFSKTKIAQFWQRDPGWLYPNQKENVHFFHFLLLSWQ